ncbi:hypothetical protein RCH33_3188 [Flavobacterium daejeonense]|nr:hypothetical protein RCH33_3188 [Flavobacterium daejeonense]
MCKNRSIEFSFFPNPKGSLKFKTFKIKNDVLFLFLPLGVGVEKEITKKL